MEKRELVTFRLKFKDEKYVPDAQGMDNIMRLVNGIIKDGGGALVLPDHITTEWLKEKWEGEINTRLNDSKTVDIAILAALDAIVVERIELKLNVPKEEKSEETPK